jgi:hypothetical protein
MMGILRVETAVTWREMDIIRDLTPIRQYECGCWEVGEESPGVCRTHGERSKSVLWLSNDDKYTEWGG